MDVLEHLPDPLGTLCHCAGLLKADGVMMIQTPCYPEGKAYEELKSSGDPFGEMLLPEQHLFLFQPTRAKAGAEEGGPESFRREKALFPYDVFLLASAQPLARSAGSKSSSGWTEYPPHGSRGHCCIRITRSKNSDRVTGNPKRTAPRG